MSRGVWIDLLCFMWLEEEQGRVRWELFEVARATGVDLSEVQKFLVEAKKADLCEIEIHGDVTNGHTEVTIINRRMYGEWKGRVSSKLRKQKQRASQACPKNVTPPSSSASSSASASALSSSPYGLSKETPSVEGVLSASPPDGGRADDPAQSKPETGLKAREADVPKRARDDRTPHQAIIALYHEILTMCPKVEVWNDDQRKRLKARWNERPERKSRDWWREYFQRCAASGLAHREGDEFRVRPGLVVGAKEHGEGVERPLRQSRASDWLFPGDRNALVAQLCTSSAGGLQMQDNDHDFEVFTSIMQGLADNFSAELSVPGLEMRFKALMAYPLAEIEAAALDILATRKFTKMPTVAEFVERMGGGSVDDRAEVEAGKVLRAIEDHGGYAPLWPFDDPSRRPSSSSGFGGGWTRICD
jgi:hypothetical protein